jgi:hypothetical protein
LTPVFVVKPSSDGCCFLSLTSMYSGQLEKFSVLASCFLTSVVDVADPAL